MPVRKTSTRLADGRELFYFDARFTGPRDAVDGRVIEPVTVASQARWDRLRGETVVSAAHRQARTHLPPADECPLCPSRPGVRSEIPDEDYEVVVFENRFPSLGGEMGGRCEVVCFGPEHTGSFADLDEERAATVLAAWIDRSAALSALPGVEQVYCFENRGAEIGVTLAHPHGQIYGYPYVTPRTRRTLDRVAAHRAETGGRNLFDDVLAEERADGRRIVTAGDHWTAFVPYAAHWPYELHLYPRRRVPTLPDLDEAAAAELPAVLLDLTGRFDRIFGPGQGPTPYVAAWHQAPVRDPLRTEFACHLELFTIRRAPGKLKYQAGSESGMDAFIGDVAPEAAAARLREVAP
ncbi:galactose-1-phosphate uridylyltransferase (plasmid) [Streptomyces sp. BI20]|uniref:galactose-1-phosphate uridylyltransferase n=1 Tax=Streptomyces sp. BI20 TaxID=3403460 RepID=UPI003C72B752